MRAERFLVAYRGEFIASGAGSAGETQSKAYRIKVPDRSLSQRAPRIEFRCGDRAQMLAHSGPKARYNLSMVVAIFLMRVLEVMFFVGLVGSAVVVLISFVEDGKELFGKD
jgi:hypothetical protein